jgi:hypothetical protein
MLYVYGIVDAPPPEVPGVRTLTNGRLAAAFRDGPAGESPLEHERVVEELMRHGAVLPTRLGTTVRDETALRELLAHDADQFAAALDRVRGYVEMSVRGGDDAARRRLHGLARQTARLTASEATAYLVPAGAAERFAAEARSLGATCTGPWPPYSFVQRRDSLTRRIDAQPEGVERGLAQLVLTIVELLRELMERQAIHRIDGGGLDDEQVARLDETFSLLSQRMQELKDAFGLEDRDLNLDLGPLGRLL